MNHVDHVFANVLRVVADALERASDPQHIQRPANGARIFHHERDALALESFVLFIHQAIFFRDGDRAFRIEPRECVERDWTQPYERHPGLVPVLRTIYADPRHWWDAYDMCEKLVDIEESFQLWRFRHLKTVERIIGHKPGTGGSSGVAFLTRALDVRFFPELIDVRSEPLHPAPPPTAA